MKGNCNLSEKRLKKMSKFSFNKETHEYKLDDVRIPSVTQILRAQGLSDFSKVDPVILKQSQELGDAVHLAIHYKMKGTLDEASLDPVVSLYLEGWNNFCDDYGYVCLETEYRGYSSVFRFAFTVDQMGEVTRNKTPGLTLLDIKTGAPKPADKIQLAGYRIGLDKKQFRNLFLLYLDPMFKPRGYKIIHYTRNDKEKSVFLSAMCLTNYKNENNL